MCNHETVTCSGCLLQIDPNDCMRTWLDGRWFFFCRTCEQNGEYNETLRKVHRRMRAKKVCDG